MFLTYLQLPKTRKPHLARLWILSRRKRYSDIFACFLYQNIASKAVQTAYCTRACKSRERSTDVDTPTYRHRLRQSTGQLDISKLLEIISFCTHSRCSGEARLSSFLNISLQTVYLGWNEQYLWLTKSRCFTYRKSINRSIRLQCVWGSTMTSNTILNTRFGTWNQWDIL